MDVTPLIRPDRQVIQSYGGGLFRISGQIYPHAVLVFPDRVLPWPVDDSRVMDDPAIFNDLIPYRDDIDILLWGTGARMIWLSPAVKSKLTFSGITPDIMDTGAACRTYNVLLAEGRRVVAALMPLTPERI